MGKSEKGGEGLLVKDVTARHSRRKLPIVRFDDSIRTVIKAMEYYRHSRRLYIVDVSGRFKGCITLNDLVEHVFHHHQWDSIHPRGLLGVITTEKAEHLMIRETIHAVLEDEVDKVVERMIDKGVEEIPILDEAGNVVADLTMIDLMRIYEDTSLDQEE